MKFRELKKSLTAKIEPIYLICGDDAFFVEYSAKLICNACLQMPEMNLTRFESNILKEDYDKFNSALLSYPFMSEKRVVMVKELYPAASEIAKLKGYCTKPNETTVLLICNTSSSENLKKLPNVTVVDCSRGDDALIAAWVKNQAKIAGLTITDGAISKLTSYCLSDMTRINGETAKLIAYCYDKKMIAENDVDELCIKESDYRLYEIVDFIAARNYDKAYASFTDMLETVGDGQKLFVSLYYYFRRLLYASISSATNAEIAEALRVKEYAVTMAKKQAKAFSPRRLKTITDKLAAFDYGFKSGQIEQTSAVWNGILEVLIG